MSRALHDIIVSRIRQQGPMDLGEYMMLCLGHPEHGYYMNRDPFGTKGDFITAPEVSQMFGEMIGAWIGDTWEKLGSPKQFALVECGPGRGTLMEDALRATKNLPGFHEALRLYLLEMSPTLKAAQKERLRTYNPVWLNTLDGLPDMPVILIGNEFLDALPIRQVAFREEWVETVIGVDEGETLREGVKAADPTLLAHIPPKILDEQSEKIFEISPVLNQYIKTVCNLLKSHTGAALFIDYGHAIAAHGNSLQAVRSHRFENPFENPGEADITAHVDFENLARLGASSGLRATPCVTQGEFLRTLGIEIRAEMLKRHANKDQALQIESGLKRLVAEDQMGTLFKVMALCHDPRIQLAGF